MAGRRVTAAPGETCQTLLQKLQQGQEDLHRSIDYLQPRVKQKKCKRSPQLRVTQVRYNHGGSSPLCCVRHLPVRRARTDQLSPNSPPSHSPRRKSRKLSSTPKHFSHPHPPRLPHSHITPPSPHRTDTSLEEGLSCQPHMTCEWSTTDKTSAEKSHDRSDVRKRAVKKVTRSAKRATTGSLIVGDLGSREMMGGGERSAKEVAGSSMTPNSLSRIAHDSESLRRRYETGGKKKSRGPTVSFVTDENMLEPQQQSSCSSHRDGVRKRRSRELSHVEEKEKRDGLTSSLNISRFGALEHHRTYRSGQPCTKAPRLGLGQRWAGDDPLLGYDWIAGLVEAGSGLEEKEEEYFMEMREFRKVNHAECTRPHPIFLPGPDETSPDSHPSLSTTSPTSHTHCTHSYVINDRLFPVSRRAIGDPSACGDHGECEKKCPVCEGRRDRGGQPVRYIRVSVPRSSVQAPYQLRRAHRRRSFDPSDSMALNKHCLAGWNSTKLPGLPPQPTVDLQSAITHSPHTRPHTHCSPSSHLAHPPVPSPPTRRQRGRPSSRSVSRRLLNASHRAEYNLRSRGHANM